MDDERKVLDDYKVALNKLRNNQRNVPEVLLMTKYRKSYLDLKQELKMATEQLLQAIVLSGLKITCFQADAIYQKINQAIEESGLLKEISHAVYRRQDLEEIMRLAQKLRVLVHQTAGRNIDDNIQQTLGDHETERGIPVQANP